MESLIYYGIPECLTERVYYHEASAPGAEVLCGVPRQQTPHRPYLAVWGFLGLVTGYVAVRDDKPGGPGKAGMHL
jgi:hypothetical protein